MVVDTSGIVHNVIIGLSENVFGNVLLTCVSLIVVLVVVSMLIGIPPVVSFGLALPLSIVLGAFGYLTPVASAIISLVFLVMSVASFLGGVGVNT